MILGSLFFVTIITVAILQAVWLVREIRTNQRQQNFLDAVTHELHTPLTSLRLYVDTLQGKSLDEEQRGEFLDVMSDDIDRLQRTIDQILSAARTEARRNHRTPVDLGGLLGECVADARERHGLDEERLRLQVPALARVRGDLEQLRVAFRNLIENAIQYAGDRTRVEVRVRPASGRKLEVEVEDQGIGAARVGARPGLPALPARLTGCRARPGRPGARTLHRAQRGPRSWWERAGRERWRGKGQSVHRHAPRTAR